MSEPDVEQTPAAQEPKPRRQRKPRGEGAQPPRRVGRFERRAGKAAETLRNLIRIGKPDLDVEGLSFLQVVDRDADAWGKAVAQLAEWFTPLGAVVDLVFGSPVAILVGLAPSVRAARRDLAGRRRRRRAEAERKRLELEEQQLAEQAEAAGWPAA